MRLHSLEALGEVGRLRFECAAGIHCPTGTWVSAVAAHPSRSRIVAAAGRTAIVADLDGGAFGGDGNAPAGSVCVLGPLARTIDCLAFLPDGTISSCGYGGVTLFRETCAGGAAEAAGADGAPRYEAVARFAKTYHDGVDGATLGYKGWLLSLAPAPTGDWLACGCSDNTVRLWRMANGQDFKCGGVRGARRARVSTTRATPLPRRCVAAGRAPQRARRRGATDRATPARVPCPASPARARARGSSRRAQATHPKCRASYGTRLGGTVRPRALIRRPSGIAVGGGRQARRRSRASGRRPRSARSPSTRLAAILRRAALMASSRRASSARARACGRARALVEITHARLRAGGPRWGPTRARRCTTRARLRSVTCAPAGHTSAMPSRAPALRRL